MDAALADLEATSQRLVGAVQGLAGRVSTAEQVQLQLQAQQTLIEEQQANSRTQRRINGWLMTSIFIDVVLSIALGAGFVRIDHNAHSISSLQERTSGEVLCPQYSLWLGLIAGRRMQPNLKPKDLKQLNDFGRVFEAGYTSLDCKPLLKK